MASIGWTEILIILVIVLLLFGANKLPDLARSMGRSARIFKSEVKEMKNDDAAGQPEQAQPQRELDANPGGSTGITNSDAQQAARPESFWDKPENQRNQ
ncbi:sec-independent protein translocase protein [Corynebacterium imitans]|uniref:Sec-independent protein translocase protein TatA n=1 Tax=Corynebacterium imitans TaxID=156978 RepID=A0A076NJH5_9CORY|nr:Sec-independent protein translocase subunit TatA [Corynebacterium imitans]AIJ33558.1 prohead protease [Corynebacterium imitans]MCG7277411.1 Sec-independent protein translocase subunit TatA [Corynebacterium imitans]MDK8306404.1 Sec-independent protein translocase subunit TatA [Corynebacterium imitans]MDK8637281.1 Sec-independent protein translocase subunit TatA [Corynebacterium imitans]MDK8772543.1 Sec-independent protein translocase subunit TatA [Corynebacterium imitans]